MKHDPSKEKQGCQYTVVNQYFNLFKSVVFSGRRGTPVVSTNTTDRHDIAEILRKVALKTITQLAQYCNLFNIIDIRGPQYAVDVYHH